MNDERSTQFATPPHETLLNRQYGSKGWELLAFLPHFTHVHPFGFKGNFRVTRETWSYLTPYSAWPDPTLLQQYEADGWQLVAAVPDATPEMSLRHLLLLKRVARG
jgi:hypothetical protein